MSGAGAEARVVPEGERAACRVGRQIGPQPALLLRTGRAAADVTAVGVQADQMPATKVEAVPALATRACPGPEEVVVTAGAWRVVVVVAGDRICAVAEAAPAGRVALGEVTGRSILVRRVAEREHRPGQAAEEGGGLLVAVGAAVGDVAGRNQRARSPAWGMCIDGSSRGRRRPGGVSLRRASLAAGAASGEQASQDESEQRASRAHRASSFLHRLETWRHIERRRNRTPVMESPRQRRQNTMCCPTTANRQNFA
jgi:hypothetical protein